MSQEITLYFVLENAPVGVAFGLQKGRGTHYETIQIQSAAEQKQTLYFECPAKISKNRDAPPDFSGDFVQGTKNERFVYLDIGTAAGQLTSVWSRRLKVPLRDITWAMVDTCLTDTTQSLVVHVEGIGKDGTPNCGTVKPFYGWHVIFRYQPT